MSIAINIFFDLNVFFIVYVKTFPEKEKYYSPGFPEELALGIPRVRILNINRDNNLLALSRERVATTGPGVVLSPAYAGQAHNTGLYYFYLSGNWKVSKERSKQMK